ncbi:unnamed protein product [Dicrocoelium dendriticum]|nr:unnamed protein product [Dicrocoelium dendriticum]
MREVEILFENIDEKLEDEMILITPKWISRTFDYHIRDSERQVLLFNSLLFRLLSDYFKAHPNLSAVYLLVGLDRSGDSLVSLVPYDRMVEAESRFSKVLTRVIYSIQRHRCPSSCTLAGNELLLNLTTDALKKLVTIPWCPADQMRPPLACCENTTDTIETSSTIQRLNIIGKDDNIKTKELRNFFAPAPKPTVVTIMPTEGPTKASSNVLETRIAQTVPAVIETSKQTPIPTTITPSDQDDDDDHFSPGVALKSSQPKRRRLIFESDEENEDAVIVKKTPEKRSKAKQASSAKRHNFKG